MAHETSGFDFATVGDNCVDRYLATGLSAIGGNALNVAVQLARLGRRVAYFGAVGDDAAGRRTVRVLAENGVIVDHVRVLDGVTAYTEIGQTPDGDRIIGFEEFGVCRGYRPTNAQVALLEAARHVHIGWFDDGGALRRTLAAAGTSVSQDLAVNKGADGLAVAFDSAGEDADRAEALIRAALGEGARIAVVTRGADGSLASDGRTRAATGIKPVEVVDTTGAGDTFVAGFLAAHVDGLPLQACLEAGRDAAAGTCTHFGGFPQVQEPF
ncbi:PfkB family carbohydrate kinase [Chthonobacter rhizosphaerae]|uniref:PfkB family carbohydrate kinase n=1 Tax=Chthonobacter rhizosphaerae TaxID=2735553 RepID=UPI0015EF4EE8|nr:PfkB family carbohydrate kinase [Chthonobacter rhizosphaerae]